MSERYPAMPNPHYVRDAEVAGGGTASLIGEILEDEAYHCVDCIEDESLEAWVVRVAALIDQRIERGVGELAAPMCPDHLELQHRDGQPPWCESCGWSHGVTVPSRKVR